MQRKTIPVSNPHANYLAHKADIDRAITGVLESGRYILGPEVAQFEKEFAAGLKIPFCVGVASGTDALALALRAVGVGPGDEVITVSHSAVATTAAIEQIGAIPVFIDIDPKTRCMDPGNIASAVNKLTKAIVPVHIYGKMASMLEIRRIASDFNLKIVEDCAQAHGARMDEAFAGTIGDAGCFSFYPTKNIGALGDGGAVVTGDAATYERLLMLRQYGWKERYISSCQGYNSRLDEVQAAILRVKLKFLPGENEKRRTIARQYSACLAGSAVGRPDMPANELHAMHLYVVETTDRGAFERFMHDNGIDTMRHYPSPIHLQPAYAGRVSGAGRLVRTERLYETIVSLPMYPELSDEDVDHVCGVLTNWLAQNKGT